MASSERVLNLSSIVVADSLGFGAATEVAILNLLAIIRNVRLDSPRLKLKTGGEG